MYSNPGIRSIFKFKWNDTEIMIDEINKKP
jgi:hypothetical protein